MKLNCWEFMNCGREPGGRNIASRGACPAAIDGRLDGVHNGRNSGRTCWMIAGTLCGGQVQGTFGAKYKNCEQCEFYKAVRQEEGMRYQLSIMLLERLKSAPVGAPAGAR